MPPSTPTPTTSTNKDQTSLDYLSTIEHFLLTATPQDLDLYVQHCRMLLSHPNHRDQPRLVLGIPTGPKTNQLFATGDRGFVLAAVRQCRCEQLEEMERERARKEDPVGESSCGDGVGGMEDEEKRFPGGNGGKCVAM